MVSANVSFYARHRIIYVHLHLFQKSNSNFDHCRDPSNTPRHPPVVYDNTTSTVELRTELLQPTPSIIVLKVVLIDDPFCQRLLIEEKSERRIPHRPLQALDAIVNNEQRAGRVV